MGVKGFWHYFAAMDLDDLMMNRVNCGSTLVVDGMNFMHHMMEVAGVFDDQSRLDRRQMGNYRQFREILLREVNALKAHGFKLEFYFDGKMSSIKVLNRETGQSPYRWVQLAKALRYHFKLVEQEQYPVGCLTRAVMEQILDRDTDLKIVQCAGEADIDIAKRCAELRAADVEAYVYSNDSDFAVTRGNFLIRLGSFTKALEVDKGFRVCVWHPRRICEVMNIKNEDMLVEFVLLLQCDFNQLVKNIDQGDFPCALPEDGRGVDNFTMLYVYLCNRPNGYQVRPLEDPHGLLALLLDYSRQFFQLTVDEEVFKQRLDAILSNIREEEISTLINSMKIHDDHVDTCTDVVERESYDNDDEDDSEDDDDEAYDRDDEQLIPRVPAEIVTALEYEWQTLTEKPNLLQIGTFVVSFLSKHPEFHESLEIDGVHMNALKQMTDDLIENKFCEEFRFTLSWEAAKVAERYQRLVRKVLEQDVYVAAIRQPDSMLLECLYDGVTFNYLVDLFEKEEIRLGLEESEDMSQDSIENDDASSVEEERVRESEKDEINFVPEEVDFTVESVHDLQSLPVDAFREDIVNTVRSKRVSFLKGETGCGKSSRIPLIIARDCSERGENCRILVCEPKKLAALALYKRVCGELAFVGLNEMITVAAKLSSTEMNGPEIANITYATTNYICKRYLRNLSALSQYTHIILDEVHERTLENDLLVMALRTILLELDRDQSFPRVLLLSATMDSLHFSNYFLSAVNRDGGSSLHQSDIATLHVGATRYSYRLHYVYEKTLKPQRISRAAMVSEATANSAEPNYDGSSTVDGLELLHAQELTDDEDDQDENVANQEVTVRQRPAYHSLLDDMFQGWCDAIFRDCDQYGISAIPKASTVKKQMQIAEQLITTCPRGHSVLVFVPGLNEISSMQTKFEDDPAYEVRCVFTNMSADQEEELLSPVPPRKIRVILATSIAESSVTLPNVHMVIDFGLDEVEEADVQYHEGGGGRSIKRYAWISRPSAVQRAGRAGRTSDGLVYRLYTKSLSQAMIPINNCETRNQPLHELILRLLNAFGGCLGNGQSLTSIFHALIDPPPAMLMQATAERTFSGALKYLHDAFLIDSTDDTRCVLTKMGAFVAMLPISTNLGRFVLYGIELGIASEAVIIAAALSKCFRPFKATNVSYRAPDDFNNDVQRDLFSSLDFDGQLYSEPIMMVSLFLKLKVARSDSKRFYGLCKALSLQSSRAFAFVDTVIYLKDAVTVALSKTNLMHPGAHHGRADNQFEEEWKRLKYFNRRYEDLITLIQVALLWASDGNVMRTNAMENRLNNYVAKFDSDQLERNKLELELFPRDRRGESRYNKATGEREPTTLPAATHDTYLLERSIVLTEVVPPKAPAKNDNNNRKIKHFSAEDILIRLYARRSMQELDIVFLWEPSKHPGLWDLYTGALYSTEQDEYRLHHLQELLTTMCATNEDDKASFGEMLPESFLDIMNITNRDYSDSNIVHAVECRNPLRLFRIQNMLPKYFSKIRTIWQMGDGCLVRRYMELFRSENGQSVGKSMSLAIRVVALKDRYFSDIDIADIRTQVLQQPVIRSVATKNTHRFPLPTWYMLRFSRPYESSTICDAPLGFRLLNAYTIRRRNHELQVNKRFHEENRRNTPWHISVEALHTRPISDRLQGSMARYAQWEMIDISSKAEKSVNETTIEQANDVVCWVPTKIDPYSYLASSLPYLKRASKKDRYLYAIANYVVEEDMGDDEKELSADQVTMLAQPFAWVAMMMSVVSPRWTQFVNNRNNNRNNGVGSGAYEECQSYCSNIRSLFIDSASRGIWYDRRDLREMVLQLHYTAVDRGRLLSSIVDENGFVARPTTMALENLPWPEVDVTASVPPSREVSHSLM